MRIFGFAALVTVGASAILSQAARDTVSIVVDADAPVANAEASARLREHALADVGRPDIPCTSS